MSYGAAKTDVLFLHLTWHNYQALFCHWYRLKVSVALELLCWNWILGYWNWWVGVSDTTGSGGPGPHEWQYSLECLPPLTVRVLSDKTNYLWTKRRGLTKHWIFQYFDAGCSIIPSMRKKFLLFSNHRFYDLDCYFYILAAWQKAKQPHLWKRSWTESIWKVTYYIKLE